ncbi:MAG TPA: universal stress protein [Dehalococcoidia bacterium]|nr:universal stress protein [Dehalococcoidia bacterium]
MRPPVVLIPLDGSAEAEAALPEAEAATRAMGRSLRLLGLSAAAGPDEALPESPQQLRALERRERLEDYLHRTARALQQRGIMTEVLVAGGEPLAALREAVAAPEVVLTVMARPRDDDPRSLAPNEAERVLIAAAAGAVLVIAPRRAAPQPA